MSVRLFSGNRAIVLKWHKIRRRITDVPFSRENLLAGLALGATMEVDMRPIRDNEFVCLHDKSLEGETNGTGPVMDMAAAGLHQLRMRGDGSRKSQESPLLLADLCAILSDPATRIHDNALLQLDLKATADTIDAETARNFATLIGPVRERLILSSTNWSAVKKLAAAAPGLDLGFDPLDLWLEMRPRSAQAIEDFADASLAINPDIEIFYVYEPAFVGAAKAGFDLVGALKSNGARVDVWTLDAGLDGGGSDGELLSVLELAFECGVDQITTNTPAAVEKIWKTRLGCPAHAP